MFTIDINGVSDAQGNPYFQYLTVQYSTALGPLDPIQPKMIISSERSNRGWDANDVWTGATSNDWGVATNWSGNVLPNASGDTLEFTSTGSNKSMTNTLRVTALPELHLTQAQPGTR